MKAVLITGCSIGGAGYELVRSFHRRGFHVFATARDLSRMAGLEHLPNMTLLKLDVTSEDDIEAAVSKVEHSDHQLDYLVNNAGIAPCMPVIDLSLDDGYRIFEANFWSTLRMCQAFMPVLIRNKGTIVTINSVNTYLDLPWMSMVNASKAAQKALMETMRNEVEPLGVRVMTVIAGDLDTQLMNRKAGTFSLPEQSLYKPIEDKLRARTEGKEEIPVMSPEKFAGKVVSDATSGKSGLVYRGAMATVIWTLMSFFPWGISLFRYYDIGFSELRAHYTRGVKRTS